MAGLPPVQLGVNILAAFLFALILRRPLEVRFVGAADEGSQPKRQFFFDLALGLTTGWNGALLGWALAGTQMLGWMFLLASAWITQRAWREQGGPRGTARWRDRWHTWNFGSAKERRKSRRDLLDQNPVLWLASRNQLKTRLLWSAVAIALVTWLVWRWLTGPGSDTWSSTFFIAVLLQAPLKWLVASEASQRWVHERQTGALELLLTTPLSVSEILRGHGLSLWRLFGVPALAILVVEMVTLVVADAFSGPQFEMGVLTLVGAVVFVWDLYALAWVGLWMGLSSRKPNQAFLGTGVRILVLPWLVFLVALFFTGIQGPMTLPVLWLIVCGLCNLVFQRWARQNLRELLRDLAPRRFGASVG